ncbi:MAG TPA: AEC family transporter [Sutterella sp.]|nr:AEC family transporter [Sutterella sp.]
MNPLVVILPDFLIIFLGLFLRARLHYDDAFWNAGERLVFKVLFPPLLFLSVAQSQLTPASAALFLSVGVASMLLAVAASASFRFFIKDNPITHASVFQCGFRFNTYIGFSICLQLFDQTGFALLALLIAFWVPISNTIAVSVLASAVAKAEGGVVGSQKSVFKIVVTNPLIIATVLGLAWNVTGLSIPTIPAIFLKHLGGASLAMGLLCIGAGLRLQAFRGHGALIVASTVERLILVPAIAWGMGAAFGLSPVQAGVLLLFAALPTAQSCYVMTATMRGDAACVAGVTTAQTLVAMATLPVWTAVIQSLG